MVYLTLDDPGTITYNSNVCREIELIADDSLCSVVTGDIDHGQAIGAILGDENGIRVEYSDTIVTHVRESVCNDDLFDSTGTAVILDRHSIQSINIRSRHINRGIAIPINTIQCPISLLPACCKHGVIAPNFQGFTTR